MSHEKFVHWLFRGGGADLWMEWRLAKFDVAAVPCGSQPAEVFLHTHKKVASLADYKGIKVRTSGAWAEIAQTMGASTVILPGSEVYPALERKVVTVPGEFFDVDPGKRRGHIESRLKNFVRLSFGPESSQLDRGLSAIERVVAAARQ